MQAFASGATCHTSCLVERIMRSSSDRAAHAELLRLAEGLAAAGGSKARADAPGAHAKVAALQHELSLRLREADPLCSELLVRQVELPFSDTRDGGGVTPNDDWSVSVSLAS